MSPARGWILGVDIGGTSSSVGAVPVDGAPPPVLRRRATRPERGGDAVVSMLVEMVDEVLDELETSIGAPRDAVLGMGVGSPGPLDRASGVVVETPNLGWTDFPLLRKMTAATGLPAVLDNDANCATYGEWWVGAGKGVRTLVGITLGTGIGGGIILDGRLFHGVSDVGGEIGHTTVRYDGRRCKCGNRGCLEAYASGPNLAARALEGLRAGRESVLAELDPDELTAASVYDAILAGDGYAREIMHETARILGAGVANAVNFLNPEMIVIGGGVTRAGDHLFEPLRDEVSRRAFERAVRACRIVPAELPESAGVIGAAGIFRARALSGERV